MIHYNSRYDTSGEIAVVPSRTPEERTKTVFRVFPARQRGTFGKYVWRDGDRIDKIAAYFLGSPNRWWEIMDLNPEIHAPAEIAPGATIRVPLSKVGRG